MDKMFKQDKKEEGQGLSKNVGTAENANKKEKYYIMIEDDEETEAIKDIKGKLPKITGSYQTEYGEEIRYRKYHNWDYGNCKKEERKKSYEEVCPGCQEYCIEKVREYIYDKTKADRTICIAIYGDDELSILNGNVLYSTSRTRDRLMDNLKEIIRPIFNAYVNEDEKLSKHSITESGPTIDSLKSKICEQHKGRKWEQGEGVAYVDGSYRGDSIGLGVAFVCGENPEDIQMFSLGTNELQIERLMNGLITLIPEEIKKDKVEEVKQVKDIKMSRNIIGEVAACMEAIKYAYETLHLSKLTIVYDCDEIKWASYGLGKAPITLIVAQYIYNMRTGNRGDGEKKEVMKIQIQSIQKTSHSVKKDYNPGNVLADGLAKLGVGMSDSLEKCVEG